MTTEIQILPVGQLLRRVAVEDGWLSDERDNKALGWGKSVRGKLKALEWFDEASENGMLGIYSSSAPIGWLTVHEDGERSARLGVFVAPKERKKGVGTEALSMALEKLFGEGVYRISVRVLEVNHKGRRFLKSCKLISEGKLWATQWVDKQPRDTLSFVITKPLYRQRKKEGTSNGTD